LRGFRCLNLQPSHSFDPLRHTFPSQPDLQLTPIEKIRLPHQSRDELPPILAGLQWGWMHPTLKAERFARLEANVLAGKQVPGRTGMDLWQILVLGGVRLGLGADWDRLEHIANYDALVRQMLGVPATPWGRGRQRVRPSDPAGQRGAAGRRTASTHQDAHCRRRTRGIRKKAGAPGAALELKVDSYVLKTDVHFPTDLNLFWAAGRKCVDLIEQDRDQCGYELARPRRGGGNSSAANAPPAISSIAAGRTRQPA
jgi:hypothetical protein